MSKSRIMKGLLAAGLAAGLLAGCSSGGTAPDTAESGASEGAVAADGETALEVWVFQEVHGRVYQTMADKWNEENPDDKILLNITTYPYEDMHSKLQLAANSGAGMPDAVDIEVGKFAAFVKGDNPPLLDLTEYVAPYENDIVEARLNLYARDGKNYGFPTHVGTTVAFYNEELMEEAGLDYNDIVTWDDFQEIGSKYKETTGKEFGVTNTIAPFTDYLVIAQKGGQLFTDEGTGTVDVNNPLVVEAMQQRVDLVETGAAGIVPSGDADFEEALGAINRGDFAAIVYPQWYASRFVDYMPDLEGKIAIAPAPVFENAQFKTIGGGGTGTAIAANSPVKEKAAEFFAYAKLSEEGNIAVWEDLGFDPVNMAVWEMEDVTHNPDNMYNQYFTTNMFDVLNEVKDGIGHFNSLSNENLPTVDVAFRTTILNDLYEAKLPVQDAMDDAQTQLANELGH